MVMMVDDMKIFIDTNILLRYIVAEIPQHPVIRQAVDGLVDRKDELWISGQIIREFSSVVTRPQAFMTTLTAADAAKELRKFQPYFNVAHEARTTVDRFLDLKDTYSMGGKQIHDANIVATMLDYKITHLFTLNTADFERFSPLITLIALDQLVP